MECTRPLPNVPRQQTRAVELEAAPVVWKTWPWLGLGNISILL